MIKPGLLTTLGLGIGVALVVAVTIVGSSATSPASAQSNYVVYLPLVGAAPSCSVPPTLLGPSNGSSLTTLAPLFQWQPVADLGATAMVLQVATDLSFSDISLVASISFDPASTIWTSGGTRLPGNLNPATVYYWRVVVQCGNFQGPYSAVWSLLSAPPGGSFLPPPTLSLPTNGTTVPPASVTLQWSTVANAIDYLVVWYDASASASFDFAYVSGTSLTIGPLIANTTYDWYVQARNDYADGMPTNPPSTFNTSASVSGQSVRARPQSIAMGTSSRRIYFVPGVRP
jgi:hypothetical protein